MFTCKHFFLLNFHCLTYSALDVQHLFCHLKIRGFWGLKYKFDLALRLYGLYGLWSKILGDGVEGVITVKTTLVPAMLTRPEKCYTATVPTSARSEKKCLKICCTATVSSGSNGVSGAKIGPWRPLGGRLEYMYNIVLMQPQPPSCL